MGNNRTDYKQVAKQLGVRYLFGRWGVSFYSAIPGEGKYWRFKLVPLDGWSFDPQEIINAIRLDDELGIINE